jgi:hypothetical protein
MTVVEKVDHVSGLTSQLHVVLWSYRWSLGNFWSQYQWLGSSFVGKCCFGILELPYVLVPCSPSVGRGQGGIFWHQGHWRPLYCPLQAGVAGLRDYGHRQKRELTARPVHALLRCGKYCHAKSGGYPFLSQSSVR